MSSCKPLLHTQSILGESPIWSPRENRLYWVDIHGKKLHFLNPDTKEHHVSSLPEVATALALEKNHRLILSFRKRIVLFDPSTQKITPLVDIEPDLPENRCNDIRCDRKGRLWIGTMNEVHVEKATGSLYCLSPDRKLTLMEKNGHLFNGINWSPDRKTMYVVQSLAHCIFSYDFDEEKGAMTNKRVFVHISTKGAVPDGIVVDREGCVWCAHAGGGCIMRYDPQGKEILKCALPVPRPSSCTFGGKNLKSLFITTARELLSAQDLAQFPLSGDLFAYQTSVQGMEEAMYG